VRFCACFFRRGKCIVPSTSQELRASPRLFRPRGRPPSSGQCNARLFTAAPCERGVGATRRYARDVAKLDRQRNHSGCAAGQEPLRAGRRDRDPGTRRGRAAQQRVGTRRPARTARRRSLTRAPNPILARASHSARRSRPVPWWAPSTRARSWAMVLLALERRTSPSARLLRW
jgi:hypothetical protein